MKIAEVGVEELETMTKYSNDGSGMKQYAGRNWIFDVEPFLGKEQQSFTEVRDDLRLKRAIRRAVCRDSAPQHLVDSILNMIRE